MRGLHTSSSWLFLAVSTTLVAALSAATVGGCQDLAGDCEKNLNCTPADSATSSSTGGGGGQGGDAGAGGDGGGGGGGSDQCDPSQGVVGDDCGMFVRTEGVSGAMGDKNTPIASLQEAIDRAGEKKNRVYACAEMFEEALTVAEGITIYGGLDCSSDWGLLADKKTMVEAPPDTIALTVKDTADGLVVNDVSFTAADATMPGGSSIAVLVDSATADFVRCAMTAANGAAGVDGMDAPSVAPMQPLQGNGGKNACSVAEPILGGGQGTNDCGGGQISVGAAGGNGNNVNGGNGGDGLPTVANKGAGGKGETLAGWDCSVDGVNGGAQTGAAGLEGTPGEGAMTSGSLTSAGYQGTSGTAGMPGAVGQGGGGGGGAKGGNICPGLGAGASGGAGGAGGCGGQPGEGAGPGGASFALASINAAVTLTGCTLVSANGGVGGTGGDFQPGALGGLGGVGGNPAGGSNPGCDGGKGGKGGNGGPGGGGLGGPSAAIAHVGAAPEQAGGTLLTPGSAGLGGPGGNSNTKDNAGADGASKDVMLF